MTREEILRASLRTVDAKVVAALETEFGARFDIFCVESAVLFDALDDLIFSKTHDPLPDNTYQSATLLWSGIKSLFCALESLRRGYFLEPCALARTALETACSALYMHVDADQYVNFRHDRFDTGRAVSCATKLSPTIQYTYSLLTNYSHTNSLHAVLQIEKDSGELDMTGSYYSENWNLFAQGILALELALRDIQQIFEYVFFDYIEASEYWFFDEEKKVLAFNGSKTRFLELMRKHVDLTNANIAKHGDQHAQNLPPEWVMKLLNETK